MLTHKFSLKIFLFFLIFSTPIIGCDDRSRSSNRPVIFVLDTFVGNESHGQDVVSAVKELVTGCEIKPISLGEKVQRNIYLAVLEDVLVYAQKNPHAKIIVNMSFGSYSSDPQEKTLIGKMLRQGIILVAAAGNDKTDRPMYPAGYPGVLAVAAVNGADQKTSYSNYGTHIRIASGGFLKSKILPQSLEGAGPGVRQNITYMIYGGTSFAAPRVSALLGLLMSRSPNLSPQDAVNVLLQTAAPLNDDAFYKARLLGAGRADTFNALYRVDSSFRNVVLVLQICRFAFIAIWLTIAFFAWQKNDLFGPFVMGLLIGAFLWGLELFTIWVWGEILGRQLSLVVWFAAGLAGLAVWFNRRREQRFIETYQFDPAVFEELGTPNPSTGRYMLQRSWLLDHLIFVEKIRPDIAERIVTNHFGNNSLIGMEIPQKNQGEDFHNPGT
jgi:hypothetical protein